MRIRKTSQYIEGGAGLPSYFTDEIDTGMKWIDGKKIYRKVFTSSVTTSRITINTNISSNNIVRWDCYLLNSASQHLKIPYYISSTSNGIINSGTTNFIYVGTGDVFISGTLTLIIEYTKTTD